MARFYIQSTLSEHIAETPEGYLLCSEVPIARTGSLEYLPEEVPITPAEGGSDVVIIYRLAEDLLSAETLASFEGKPFTIEHPPEGVSPDNWRDLAVGHSQNVRRGSGADSDLMLADLLVTDREAIDLIKDGSIREISCGYDAEYEQIAPGVGKQVAIIGNHTALVEAGRCGPRVAVRDQKGTPMKLPAKKVSFFDRLTRTISNPKVRRAMDEAIAEGTKDEETQPQPSTDEPQPATDGDETLSADVAEMKLMLRSVLEMLGAGNTADEEQATDNETADADGTNDEDPSKTQDADGEEEPAVKPTQDARRRSADKATVSRATILAPGLHARVGDSTIAVQRAALTSAMSNKDVRRTVDALLGGKALSQVDRLTLDAAFIAAAEIVRHTNNTRTVDALTAAGGRNEQGSGQSPAELNAYYAQHYGMKG